MYKKACYLFSYGKLAYKGFVYTAVSLTWLCAIHKHSKNSTFNTKAFIKEQMHLPNKYLLHGSSPIQVGKVCKTSFAGHCKSLEIRLLDSELKGRKWGNMYSTGIFSNTPTIKEESLAEIDLCLGVELPYGHHWSVFTQIVYLQHWGCGNHPWTGQYLKGFCQAKMFSKRSFLLGNPSLIVIFIRVKKVMQRLMFYGEGLNLGGLTIIRLLCKYYGGYLYV